MSVLVVNIINPVWNAFQITYILHEHHKSFRKQEEDEREIEKMKEAQPQYKVIVNLSRLSTPLDNLIHTDSVLSESAAVTNRMSINEPEFEPNV